MTLPADGLTDTLQIHLVREPLTGSPLATDYLSGTGAAPRFFPGDPFALASFQRKLAEVSARFGRADRERAARAVRPTSDAARERLARFVEQGGAMITTGQQAGLLSGPLYTVYKALTAARLADELEQRLDLPVVPVFWVASEDHDWEEVNHVHLGIPADGVRRLELLDAPTAPHPMAVHPLGSTATEILDEIAQLIGGAPFGDEVLTLIRGAYSPGRSVAAAFAEMMEAVLAPFGVCVTEASHPVVKEASVDLLQRALVDAADHEALLAARTEELVEARYTGQVTVLPGATNVFLHGPHGRLRVYRAGDRFSTPDSGEEFGREELLARLRSEPSVFSPNVFLRPVVESTVFPTLAYVAGPGEISYFAQVTALFPAYGIESPVVFPRGSLTLVEPAMQRLLDKLGLSVEALDRPIHVLGDELAR